MAYQSENAPEDWKEAQFRLRISILKIKARCVLGGSLRYCCVEDEGYIRTEASHER